MKRILLLVFSISVEAGATSILNCKIDSVINLNSEKSTSTVAKSKLPDGRPSIYNLTIVDFETDSPIAKGQPGFLLETKLTTAKLSANGDRWLVPKRLPNSDNDTGLSTIQLSKSGEGRYDILVYRFFDLRSGSKKGELDGIGYITSGKCE